LDRQTKPNPFRCMPGGEKHTTILIVDDDGGLRRLIEKSLQRQGYVTGAVASGKEALAWLGKNKADLLLLDLKLQDIDGLDLVRQISQDRPPPAFVVITGQGDERVAVEMMKRGARDYLVKDVDFLQFVPEVVKRVLDQIETERRLAAAEAESKRLQKEILEISDREQRRIGRDLHDGLCQQLAGIELMSQALEQKIAARSRADAARAAEIAGHVREAIRQTRLLARGLSPVTLESEGLMSALQEFASNTEKIFHVQCRFECETSVTLDDPVMATHLFRITQEAVSNAVKHGKAKTIALRLGQHRGRVRLSILDDGSGFPDPVPRQKGMGLRLMESRAGMIGGMLVTENQPGGGARVICEAPLVPARSRIHTRGRKELKPENQKTDSHR
jgi:signal transduction histidine kinase